MIASLNVNADTLTGVLDLSNLYGKTNAGKYNVTATMLANRSAVIEVNQSLTDPPGSEFPGELPQICMTEFKINAGSVTLTLEDVNTKTQLANTKEMSLVTYFFDETDRCTAVDELVQGKSSFMAYFNMGSVQLNYPAPFGYDKIMASFSVFPYSYSVSLPISKNSEGKFYVADLQASLSLQLKRGYKESLSYYVSAEKELSSLSLGTGYIELY